MACLVAVAVFLLLLGQGVRAEDVKGYVDGAGNVRKFDTPATYLSIGQGTAIAGTTYYITLTENNVRTSQYGRAMIHPVTGAWVMYSNNTGTEITAIADLQAWNTSSGPTALANGVTIVVKGQIRSGGPDGSVIQEKQLFSYTGVTEPWDGGADGQTVINRYGSMTIGGDPNPLTFYLPVRNVCQESRPVYLQVQSTVTAIGSSTTVSPVGIVPPLYTYQKEAVAPTGTTWAWFIGQTVVASGVVTAAQQTAGAVYAEEVMFTCPDTIESDGDGDGIPDSEDNDRDGDGIPDDKDLSPDGPDYDGDGFPDKVDADDDNDGIADENDKTPRGGAGDTPPNDGTKTPDPPSSGGTVTPPNPKPPPTGNPTTGAAGEIDVYDDVKAALEDVAAQTNVPEVDGTVDLGAQPEGVGEKAVMSRIDSNIATAEKEVGNVILQMIEFGAENTGIDLPTGLGKKSWWDLTFDWIDGSTKTVRVDLSPYDTTVNALRNLCLFVAYIGAWWFSVKTIRGGIA